MFKKYEKGFSLIELLRVSTIWAILSPCTVITANGTAGDNQPPFKLNANESGGIIES